MAVQRIRRFGDPVLRTRSEPVVDFDRELQTLVTDLMDTMLDAPGAGLAAAQVGVGLRVFAYHVDGMIGHLVNPTLTLSHGIQDDLEGCLSIPGLRFTCRRAVSVVARGQDMFGEPLTVEGTGILARALQHETDHVDGHFFVDRLVDGERRAAMRAIRAADWTGGPAVFGRAR